MSAFDKVIGYASIKNELMQICDMIKNKEIYETLGAQMPRGILLHGNPGLGKTLMAKCFIEESGLPAYILRKNSAVADFMGEITAAFKQAKENAPAVIFLDDMDKFANSDEKYCDADEYVAVQAGIDDVKNAEVFVLATANNIDKLPPSLIRPGRFDKKIEVCPPSAADANEIIRYFLRDKKIAEDLNFEDIAMMIQYNSCAELETIFNEAAICAAYARRDFITMQDVVNAVLRRVYEAPDSFTKTSAEKVQKTAVHEAGHLVMCEVLCPQSVGIASIRSSGRDSTGGFVRKCKDFERDEFYILVALAGKAAEELCYAETYFGSCRSDMKRAINLIRKGITEACSAGFSFMDVETRRTPGMSESLNSRNEAVVHAELERYMLKAKNILLKNREFMENVAAALMEKETLLYSDVKALRDAAVINEAAI